MIIDAIERASEPSDRPTAIIMETVKGKGVSFMENNAAFHGKAANEEEREIAIMELTGGSE